MNKRLLVAVTAAAAGAALANAMVRRTSEDADEVAIPILVDDPLMRQPVPEPEVHIIMRQPATSKYEPHQGERERKRRLKRLNK